MTNDQQNLVKLGVVYVLASGSGPNLEDLVRSLVDQKEDLDSPAPDFVQFQITSEQYVNRESVLKNVTLRLRVRGLVRGKGIDTRYTVTGYILLDGKKGVGYSFSATYQPCQKYGTITFLED